VADRLGLAAALLALAGIGGVALLLRGAAPYSSAGLALAGGVGAAACGGVALLGSPRGASPRWLALGAGLLGVLAAVAVLAWAVGLV